MKFLLDVLERHQDDVARVGATVPAHCSFVLLTPQFRTSRSAVFLIVDQKTGTLKVAPARDIAQSERKDALANL